MRKRKKLFRTQFFFGYNRSDVMEYIRILEQEVEKQRKAASEREVISPVRYERPESIFELEEYIKILEKKLLIQRQQKLVAGAMEEEHQILSEEARAEVRQIDAFPQVGNRQSENIQSNIQQEQSQEADRERNRQSLAERIRESREVQEKQCQEQRREKQQIEKQQIKKQPRDDQQDIFVLEED